MTTAAGDWTAVRASSSALRVREEARSAGDAADVTAADFDAALADSRASVTPELEREYEQMAARLKQDASAIQPIGFAFPPRTREGG